MTTLPAVLAMVKCYLKSTLVSGRGLSCPHYFSTLLWTGSCGAPLRIRSGALNGHLFPTWRTRIMLMMILPYQHTATSTFKRRRNFAQQVGLNISSKKTEIMTLNTNNTRSVQIDNHKLPYTDRFTYLDSIISRDGGTDLDIQSRLTKARNSLNQENTLMFSWLNLMNKVWRSPTYTTRTKLIKSLSQLRPHDSPVWFRMLALNGEGFITPRAFGVSYAFFSPVISNNDLFERC